MICVVIKGPSFQEAKEQITAALEVADLVELYLDAFTSLDIPALKELRAQFAIPMLFTLRSKGQGGTQERTEQERLDLIRRLAALKPEYLDLEICDPPSFVQEIATAYPEINIILSYHNFEETPDLESNYSEMCKTPASVYKIAAMANSSLDAMRLLYWKKKKKNMIAISMGPYGQISRILAPLVGSFFTYASLASGQESAPGQLRASTLIERYHYPSLNSNTAVYGLIGDPIDASISDITHNHIFKTFGIDAVYVKIPLKVEELPDFLEWAKKMDVKGLSVTMPLKEAILPFLDTIDEQAKKIGAVNTLRFDNGKIFGCNTDGAGALNALEGKENVKNKKIIILGAGGAAKAIAYEAHKRGALLTIVNRDLDKAKKLASKFLCNAYSLDKMYICTQEGYDILINTTPLELPIDPSDILPTAVVMDIKTRPLETLLLKHAAAKGCSIAYGYEMFILQALGQFHFWFGDQIPQDLAFNTLTIQVPDCLSRTQTRNSKRLEVNIGLR